MTFVNISTIWAASALCMGLMSALERAAHRIETNPFGGLPSPRPNPALARVGRAWIKAGRYWVAYRPSDPPVVVAVFYETADIPGRL